MLLESLILGSVALNAVVTLVPSILGLPRVKISNAALTRLGAVTDTEYLTLEPVSLLPAVEITNVQVIEDPVPGTYAKVWVYLKANSASPVAGDFCRIIDDDTGVVVGYKKDYYIVGAGNTWVVKYDGIDDWRVFMPNRIWNLRIETGTN